MICSMREACANSVFLADAARSSCRATGLRPARSRSRSRRRSSRASRSFRRCGARVDRHFFRDHEGRIKADAKLPDEVRVVLARLELLEKRLRPGVRDRAEILDQLGLRHADAGVREGDRFRLVVGGDGDLQRQLGLEDLGAGGLEELELLRGVGGIGDQLADEDFLIGVEGVGDDLEQLPDLRLERVFFRGGHKGGRKKRILRANASPQRGGDTLRNRRTQKVIVAARIPDLFPLPMKIFVDGAFYPEAEAKVSVFDHGFLYGDGIFEGIRIYNGRVFKLAEHLDRLWDSARAICLTIPMTRDGDGGGGAGDSAAKRAARRLHPPRGEPRQRRPRAGPAQEPACLDHHYRREHSALSGGEVRDGHEDGDNRHAAHLTRGALAGGEVAQLPQQHHGQDRGQQRRRRRGADAE